MRTWLAELDSAARTPAVKAIPGGLGGYGPVWDSWTWNWAPGSTGTNFGALAGDVTRNGTVAICLRWLEVNALSGPKLCVGGMDDDSGKYDEDPDHELTDDIKRPNPFQPYSTLLGCTVRDIAYPGYSYWIKGNDERGKREYYWVPPTAIQPEPAPQGSPYPLLGYWYLPPGGGNRVWLETSQVVHFRYGADPWCMWQGLSPLAAQVRSVVALNSGEGWTAGVLGHGHKGTLITPKDSGAAGLDESHINALRRRLAEQTSAAGAGGIAGLPEPIDATGIGFSPEEALIDRILDRPEGMVLASLGLNALVTGLPSSAETRTYSNLGEAKMQAAEYGLKPLLSIIAETLQTSVLPDYEGEEPQSEIWWDFIEYAPLQEDADSRATRAVSLYDADLATKNEGRELVGLPLLPPEKGDKFKSEIGMEQAAQMIALSTPEEPADEGESEGDGPRALNAPEDEAESEAADAA